MPLTLLPDEEIRIRLLTLPSWDLRPGELHRTFSFRDFSEAFGWMTRAALAAEKRDHHPDWSNVYSTVDVRLSTHDAGGITTLDFELAAEFERLYEPVRLAGEAIRK